MHKIRYEFKECKIFGICFLLVPNRSKIIHTGDSLNIMHVKKLAMYENFILLAQGCNRPCIQFHFITIESKVHWDADSLCERDKSFLSTKGLFLLKNNITKDFLNALKR